MAQSKRSSGGSGGPPGCLFWLLLLCVVLLLFLVNLGKIKETIARTNFKEILTTQRKAEDGRPAPVAPAPKVELDPPKPAEGDNKPGPVQVPATPAPSPAPSPSPGSTQDKAKPAPAPAAVDKPKDIPAKRRSALLYFCRIDDDGVIVRQEVKRQIPASDQPLTDSLAALLGGPTEEELRRSLVSLIPQGTRLLSAQVRGTTVFLNFNEAFMYNHYGIEGYAGQLKQVVYTATAFSSVHDVQILIEGERHDYLGGEGVYIGRPLARNSF